MRLIGLAVILTLSLILAPLAVEAQQTAKSALTNYESLSLILTGVGMLALVLTLIVYYRQLGRMSDHLRVARDAATAQSILSLLNFLQEQYVREARYSVITGLRG